jgi:SAM-dependent methyltransferase
LAAIPFHVINFKAIARNLTEGPGGLFTTPEHIDLGFLSADSTKWSEIEEISYWYKHRNRCFVSLVRRFSPEGPLFEVGSGNGYVALALQDDGMEVVAIEPTVNAALTSRQRGLRNVICARFEEAGFAPGSLSNVGLFDVLEHVEDDAGFVRRLRALMPHNGCIYCAVPAWNLMWSAEDDAAGHRRRYTLGGLSRIFEAAGFQIEYEGYFFTPLIIPIFVFRTMPRVLRLRTLRTPRLSRREHTLPQNPIGSWLGAALDREARLIAKGGTRRLGASCLLVGRAV